MKLLPHRRFTIETKLAPSEVIARLRDAIEPPKTFTFSRPERPLIGHVDGAAFDVIRAIRGRNSFLPRVRGVVEPAGRGTRLTGTMRLHEFTLVFIGAFFLMAGSVFIRMVIDDLRSGRPELPTLIPLGVLTFLTAMTLIGFVPETHRTLAELRQVVDGSHGEMR